MVRLHNNLLARTYIQDGAVVYENDNQLVTATITPIDMGDSHPVGFSFSPAEDELNRSPEGENQDLAGEDEEKESDRGTSGVFDRKRDYSKPVEESLKRGRTRKKFNFNKKAYKRRKR